MPVSFKSDGDEAVEWKQQFQRPTVYLDTWAIRAIASSAELSDRFSMAIKEKGGTWLLASLTVGEFARFEDPRHAAMADELLAKVVPHIYLFRTDPLDAWPGAREWDNTRKPMPPADSAHLDYFARRYHQTQSVGEALKGMFGMLHQSRDRMAPILDELADKITRTIAESRQVDGYRAKAKARQPDRLRTRPQIISGELLRDLILDLKAPISRNDALDLMHAVDAVNYCDHVVLDKGWERRVNSLRSRIEKSGNGMSIARCYSQRNKGLEVFLAALEGPSS